MAVGVTSIEPQEQSSSGWPERLCRAAQAHATAADAARREAQLAEIWTLVGAALLRYARTHARPYGAVRDDDLRDIAAEKAMALCQQLETGAWQPASLGPPQLCLFLSRVARNGLFDYFRGLDRERRHGLRPRQEEPGVPASPLFPPTVSQDETPEDRVARLQYAEALRDCAMDLRPRARRAWFLRVFYDLGSRDIAADPRVGMSPGAVDVALKRSRDLMGDCMRKKGLAASDMPTGTFSALWDHCRSSFEDEDPPR
jgi:DNA-directed RNA polymerase specialized sigma24 family protein